MSDKPLSRRVFDSAQAMRAAVPGVAGGPELEDYRHLHDPDEAEREPSDVEKRLSHMHDAARVRRA